jgi:hypothetical protein
MLPPQKDYLSPKDRKGVLFPYPHLPRVKIKCKIPSFLSREESLLEKAGLYSFPLKVFFFFTWNTAQLWVPNPPSCRKDLRKNRRCVEPEY